MEISKFVNIYKKMNKDLSHYIDELLAQGRHHFTTAELEKAKLSVSERSLPVSLSRLAKKGKIKMIKRGFGIILGPGGHYIDPSFYIDALMNFLGAKYYVALLTAAGRWGASHQASMAYQIITDKVVYPVTLGVGRLQFITKKDTFPEKAIERVTGEGGYFLVSSPELTAIDLLRFPKVSGHLSNIATVLDDLVEKWDGRKMISLCHDSKVPTVTLQRLGFILDKILNYHEEAEYVLKALVKRKISKAILSNAKKNLNLIRSEMQFDEKWQLFINTKVEPD